MPFDRLSLLGGTNFFEVWTRGDGGLRIVGGCHTWLTTGNGEWREGASELFHGALYIDILMQTEVGEGREIGGDDGSINVHNTDAH